MIKQLSPDLIREIAAGEVIDAPVDVVKELLDNALDAGATRLDIELLEGGAKGIVLTDNGEGIAKDDLPLTVGQHHTSKLESLTSIKTLGFRGEGLFALQHAARVKLTSRPSHQLGGASIVAHADEFVFEEHPAPSGTRVEVTQLFDDLPARKHVLEPASEELRKITQLLSSYLLHHPYLKLRLVTDANERWQYAGGSFNEAVKFFWGPVTANRLLDVCFESVYKLSGLLSRPELTRPRRDRLLLAVNGRPIQWQDKWLKSILKAYGDLLPVGHYPVGVLNLHVPPEAVLVNTAPDKKTVRFLEEDAVLAFLEDAVSASLANHPLAPALPTLEPLESISSAPRHSFPALKHLGTYRDLYVLAQADDTLWVIDQHAAHERILFEELETRYQQEAPVELSHAELIPLSIDDIARFEARKDDLAKVGIKLEPFGGGQWRVRSVPAFLANHANLLAELVKEALQYGSFEVAWRRILGRLACLPAIKAGKPLSDLEVQGLLEQLRRCHTPWSCPHGRPTALVLSEFDLAKKFGRTNVRATKSAVSIRAKSVSK